MTWNQRWSKLSYRSQKRHILKKYQNNQLSYKKSKKLPKLEMKYNKIYKESLEILIYAGSFFIERIKIQRE